MDLLPDCSSARVATRRSFYRVPVARWFPALGTVFWLSIRVRGWPLDEFRVVLRTIQRFGKDPVGDVNFSDLLFRFSVRL